MAIKLATAWIKNSVRFIMLFHKDEGDSGTGTESKGNEQCFKKLTHSRVEVVVHEISDSIGHCNSRNERHNATCNNQVRIRGKPTIARPNMGQKTKDKGSGKGSYKGNANVFLHYKRESKGKNCGDSCSNRIIEIPPNMMEKNGALKVAARVNCRLVYGTDLLFKWSRAW